MIPAVLPLLAAAVWAQVPSESPEARTRRVLDLVLARQYDQVYALFGPEMRQAMTAEEFRRRTTPLEAMGAPAEIGAASASPAGAYTTVVIPVRWTPASLRFSITWNAEGKIAGMLFRPAEPPPAPYARPSYSRPDAFTERDVTVGEDPWKLPGTLSLPNGKGPFPGVVLVHGSGPHDRDETIGPNKVFRDLAEGLASRGVAVLRYEKRTRTHAARCAAEPAFTMTHETVEDALRAAALLRSTPSIDPQRVFVLGHSQGGYMMPRILRGDARLAGGIVMAGNARPLETLVVEQMEHLAGLPGAPPEQRKVLEAVRQDPWKALRLPESYRKDLQGYRPAEEIAKLPQPLLFLQGGRDYQVTLVDLELWKAALKGRSNATFRTYPDLNHLFISGEGKSAPQEYQKSGHVQEIVVTDLDRWLGSLR